MSAQRRIKNERNSWRYIAALSPLLLATQAFAAGALSTPSNASLVGKTSAEKQITVLLSLPSQDPDGAASFATHVSTPGDPLYRHYLTPEQFAARFGANESDYEATVAWAKARGMTVGEHFVARTILPVTGAVATMESAMGVTFSDYLDKTTGRTFYAASSEAHLPAAIASKVDGVIGLSSAVHFTPHVKRLPLGVAPNESGSGPNGAFSASDLRSIYSIPAESFGTKTQTLAVFEQGGFDPADVATYLKHNKLPTVPVQARSVNDYGTGIDDPDVELEAVLDIDMQIAMNPTAKQIIVYEDGSDAFPVALVASFSAMATDGIAKSISVSYGEDEGQVGKAAMKAENTVLTELAAQGQAVFASAGDNGAYGNYTYALNVADPASQPMLTGVGGTTVFTVPGPFYQAEEVWNELGIGLGATGGGISRVWPIPSYQNAVSYLIIQNGGSETMRNVPDVAAVGDPVTGVAVYSFLNGGWLTVGGTSVSAPIWAGFYSLVNAASEGLGFGSAGFANPALYTLGPTYN